MRNIHARNIQFVDLTFKTKTVGRWKYRNRFTVRKLKGDCNKGVKIPEILIVERGTTEASSEEQEPE